MKRSTVNKKRNAVLIMLKKFTNKCFVELANPLMHIKETEVKVFPEFQVGLLQIFVSQAADEFNYISANERIMKVSVNRRSIYQPTLKTSHRLVSFI